MFINKKVYMELVDENERLKEIIHKLEEHGAIYRSEVKRVSEINDELQRHIKALNKELKEAQKNNVLNAAWSEG